MLRKRACVNRAAVLIGVDRSGGLPVLQDAVKGAHRMADWARAQGIDPVVVLSDENAGSVAITEIKQAIKGIVDAATTDQLLVYFGHRFPRRRSKPSSRAWQASQRRSSLTLPSNVKVT